MQYIILLPFYQKTLFCAPEKIKFKLLLPATMGYTTSDQLWLVRQRLLISDPLPASASSPP